MARVEGQRALLVPYAAAHVLRYHSWMQDPSLLHATASEPLTLEQEHLMQASWAADPHKCTFIVLDKQLIDPHAHGQDPHHLTAMVGDVNLYMNDPDEKSTAEIEVMIAEKDSRGKGLGKEAVQLMMVYAIQRLNIRKFCAKIGDMNIPSRNLFERLGYVEVGHSSAFNEVTVEILADAMLLEKLCTELNMVQIHEDEREQDGYQGKEE